MTERPPSEPERRGKFASARDQVLHELSLEGWACESCGSSDGPTGHFAWMANGATELPDILDVLGEQTEQAGLTDPNELVGFWLLHENNEGFVEVQGFETEDELRAAYGEIEAQLDALDGDQS